MFDRSYHKNNLAQTHLENLGCQNLVVDYKAFVVVSFTLDQNNSTINLDLYRQHCKEVEKLAYYIAVAGFVVDFHIFDFNEKAQTAADVVKKALYSSIGFAFRNVDYFFSYSF